MTEPHRPPGRRAQNRAARAAFNTARTHGLVRRHANKLSRGAGGDPSTRAHGVVSHPGTPGEVERLYLADGFGARLRQLRRAAGLTQQQLAERAGCSRESVSRLERGCQRPESRSLHQLVRPLTATRQECRVVKAELRTRAGASMREWRRGGTHYVDAVIEDVERLDKLNARRLAWLEQRRRPSDTPTDRSTSDQHKQGR